MTNKITEEKLTEICQQVEERSMKGLHRVIVVFVSPITNDIEYRVAYFNEVIEAALWRKTVEAYYNQLEIEIIVISDYVKSSEL